VLKKKIWANFQRIIELFTQKIVTKFSKIRLRDPGSGKGFFRIPDPGVKKAPDPGFGSATLFYTLMKTEQFLKLFFTAMPVYTNKNQKRKKLVFQDHYLLGRPDPDPFSS
jgi:hypothetical protein